MVIFFINQDEKKKGRKKREYYRTVNLLKWIGQHITNKRTNEQKIVQMWLPWRGRGVPGLMFAGYVPLASQSAYHIIVYFLANCTPHLSHFLENVSFAIPT